MEILIGIDIGQRTEPTAITLVEADDRTNGKGRVETHFLARHLERLPLGESYLEQAARLAEIIIGARQRGATSFRISADATGVGQPIVDLLEEQAGCRIGAVFFTHGDQRSSAGGVLKLGKGWLVSKLQALLQAGRLHLIRTPEAEALKQDLLSYEIRVDPGANEKPGAFRVGPRDDLITALGLAIQGDEGSWRRVRLVGGSLD